MPRSVNAVASRARRKRILKAAKGFYGKRKNVYTVAKNVLEKGLQYRYVGRKLKKISIEGGQAQTLTKPVSVDTLLHIVEDAS